MTDVFEPHKPKEAKIKLSIASKLRIIALGIEDIISDLEKQGRTDKAYELCGAATIVKNTSERLSERCPNAFSK